MKIVPILALQMIKNHLELFITWLYPNSIKADTRIKTDTHIKNDTHIKTDTRIKADIRFKPTLVSRLTLKKVENEKKTFVKNVIKKLKKSKKKLF